VVDSIDREEMASSYGFALAFMNSNPELKKLFGQAVKETWTADRFIAKLRGTKFFQKHSANVRNAILQETSDPATYQANVDQMYSTVRDAVGATLGTDVIPDRQMRAWAETAHRMGWSQAELMDRIGNSVNYRKQLKSQSLGGSAAEVSGQLDQLAAAYGINVGPQQKATQVKRLVSGDDTLAGIQARYRDQAAREYAAFADQLQAGQTVQDIADPYILRMADLLEVSPDAVGVKDKLVQSALRQRTPDGKPAAASLSDFEDMVRKDKRWQYTDNAREEMAGITQNVLSQWGLV
jgi:hypothetical protein